MSVQARGEWPPGAWEGDSCAKPYRCVKYQACSSYFCQPGVGVGGDLKNASGKSRPQTPAKELGLPAQGSSKP